MNENYYVYCQGLLGVKTNISNFKWIYGSMAPLVSQSEYEMCIVKFEIYIKSEKHLRKDCGSKRFQSYFWDGESRTISCRRSFFGNVRMCYDITIENDRIVAEIGNIYYKFVKKRVMNLHGAYYLLSDIANMMLLRRGYLTLYGSAVHFSPQNKGIVCFAPPNTGKTVTAMKLCGLPEYSLVGEDVIITDGKRLFACPWTSSYRKGGTSVDSAGSLGRVKQANVAEKCESCDGTELFVLSLGEKNIQTGKEELLRQVNILNGYLFNYYSSPIIKILALFASDYDENWNERASKMLAQLADSCNCYILQTPSSCEFSEIIQDIVSGENV